MDIFKVTVAVDGRALEAFVKAGVIAMIETGSRKNEVHSPQKQSKHIRRACRKGAGCVGPGVALQ
jgi:hypothetical protein